MPRLPTLTAKKLIKALKKDGYVLNRITGSHHIFTKKSAKRTVAIPVHAGKDLGRGLVKSILKQAKLTEQELLDLL